MMVSLSYFARAAVLGFGVFFVANLLVGALTSVLALRWRGFDRMEARQAAGLLLALRLLPAAIALAITGVVLIPGFLMLERQQGSEPVSEWSLVFAATGLLGWIESLVRTSLAVAASRRWDASAVLETPELFVAVAGLWRPRIIASRGFLDTVPEAQQTIALRHELAHFESWDNLKRLVVMITPRLLPFADVGLQRLDAAWLRFAERSADDAAVAGDPDRAVLLAEVLVRTARSRYDGKAPVLMSALIGSSGELGARVERLLAGESRPVQGPGAVLLVLVVSMPLAVAVFTPARPLFEAVERFLLHL